MIAPSRRRHRVFLPYNGSLLWDLGVDVRRRRRFGLSGVCQGGGSFPVGADIGLTIVATLVGVTASVITPSSDVVLHPVNDSQIRLDRCRLSASGCWKVLPKNSKKFRCLPRFLFAPATCASCLFDRANISGAASAASYHGKMRSCSHDVKNNRIIEMYNFNDIIMKMGRHIES